MDKLRSHLFTGIYFGTGTFWGTITVLTWLLPPLLRHRIIISWTIFSVNVLKLICGVNYRVIGDEYVKNLSEPVVVILSKHQSTWETLFLQGYFFPISTVLKKELVRLPFFGWGLSALRPIAIDRSDPIGALKKVKTEGVKTY